MGLFISLLVGLAWFTFVLGGVLAWVGWRGRRINDHPTCRKCGFDLVGHAAALSGSGGEPVSAARCPECGTALGAPKAIRIGQRVRRSRFLAIGLVMVLIGGVGVGASAFATAAKTNWNTYKPTWLLVLEAENPSPGGGQGVYTELVLRHTASPASFAGERADRLVAVVLRVQGDRAAIWHPAMGQLLEALRVRGLVDDARWKIYARQALDPIKVEVADTIEEGDILIVRTSHSSGRRSIGEGWRRRGCPIARRRGHGLEPEHA